MAPPDLKNEPLGVKHKNYNEWVRNAIAENKILNEREFQPEIEDLDNFMKIDLAANEENIDFILSVLKCKDMLYVSRALSKSQWLVEDKYENIINPQYLNNELFPYMTTEATIKLSKFIRQHLRNESRVEEFLKSETNAKIASKWLSRCSVTFIEKNIQTYMHHMKVLDLKRVFEKSETSFESAMKSDDYIGVTVLKSASFLINTHLQRYLDAVEKIHAHGRPRFNAKATNKVMKQCSDRIKNKFEIYASLIHIPTFVQYFKSEEIKPFLYKQSCEHDNHHLPPRFFKYNSMKIFVSKLPKDEQFEFVKKHFIDKGVMCIDDSVERDSVAFASMTLCKAVCAITPSYVWYEFAPFDIAFTEIKKLIHTETNFREKTSMLKVLLICTAGDMKHIQAVLSYYLAQHIKDGIDYKNDFITNIIAHTDIHKYDDDTWTLLDKILVNIEVYQETTRTQKNCLEIVIIRSIFTNKPIPEIIMKKFSLIIGKKISFTLGDYQKKLRKEDCDKVFGFLYDHAIQTLQDNAMESHNDLITAYAWLNYLLDLLLDYKKSLKDYPLVLDKIREFITIISKNRWMFDLEKLYNKNKSWRKYMFAESVVMNPTEEVCVNAIKHDPELLQRFKEEVKTICYDDTVSLGKLLNKLRIYWPNSLAADWSKSYVASLDELKSHKALIRGLCAILPQNELKNMIKKYAPQNAKIDWTEIDELSLSLQRGFAKNMHIARPKPSPDEILLYAKGDYLQYALPSLLAIYYNLSRVESKTEVPKLLDAPVSLQKHGLRFAFIKLDHNEVKAHISNVWKTCKNSSIRTVAFQLMFKLLQKEKSDDKAKELWELLQVFVDDLSFEEDDKIYELLPCVNDVPLCVRPMFLIKSYKFLKTLIQNTKKDRDGYQYHVDRLAEETRDLMEFMPTEFILEIIGEFVENKLFVFDKHQSDVRSGSGMVTVLSSYLLCTKDEDVQIQRYEDLFAPIMKRALDMWDETCEGSYFIRRNFQQLLRCLLADLNNFVIKNKMNIPVKMFTKIQNGLQNLPISENYLMTTMWKLTVKLSELIEKSNEKDDWNKICVDIGQEFGKFCLQCLREDVNLYFTCIYVLFSKGLETVLADFPIETQLEIFEQMLSDKSFVQGYLTTVKVLPNYGYSDDTNEKKQQLKKIIENHPSVEVKMHYYSNFKKNE